MSIFGRLFGKGAAATPATGVTSKAAQSQTMEHLRAFLDSHSGCEAYIEPATRVTQTTMVIVADTGEWTRRKVPDEQAARKVAKDLGVVVFDVNLSGYPSRMREWNEKHRNL